jgi:transposase
MNGSVKPTRRRYSSEMKDGAVRMVLASRGETGENHASVKRVAEQLNIGVESLRSWVKQHEINRGAWSGTSTGDAERTQGLEQENRELRRANEILRRASVSSRSSTTHRSDRRVHRRQPGALRGRADLPGVARRPIHLLGGQDPATVGPGAAGSGDDADPIGALGGELPSLRRPQTLEGRPAADHHRWDDQAAHPADLVKRNGVISDEPARWSELPAEHSALPTHGGLRGKRPKWQGQFH